MTESFKYIETLCAVGNATVICDADFEKSYSSINKFWLQLQELDYNTMFAESKQYNAKSILEAWHSSRIQCITITYLRDNIAFYLGWLKKLLNNDLRDHGALYRDNKTWTFEEWREYRCTCDDTLYLWQKRITELLEAYGYPLPKLRRGAPNIKRPDEIITMFADIETCDDFFCAEMPNASQWAHRTAEFAKQKKLSLYYNKGEKLLFTQIAKEHKNITSFGSYRQTLYTLGIRPKKES